MHSLASPAERQEVEAKQFCQKAVEYSQLLLASHTNGPVQLSAAVNIGDGGMSLVEMFDVFPPVRKDNGIVRHE